jgi:CIC family chloride channel protein
LTSVIMIFEMTRDYSIIVPLMIANLVSYVISSRLQEEPIYEALQHQDGVHLPGGARTREPVLTVGDGLHSGPDFARGHDATPCRRGGRSLARVLAGGGRKRPTRHARG